MVTVLTIEHSPLTFALTIHELNTGLLNLKRYKL